MAQSWRWHILHRHVITCWERVDFLALLCVVFLVFCRFPIWFLGSVVVLDCNDFWILPSALLLYRENINEIFLSGTTIPSTLIFGMQYHLVRLYQFYSIWGTETIKWTRLRAHTLAIGFYWKNIFVWHHKAYNIDICYVASPSIPLLGLFT